MEKGGKEREREREFQTDQLSPSSQNHFSTFIHFLTDFFPLSSCLSESSLPDSSHSHTQASLCIQTIKAYENLCSWVHLAEMEVIVERSWHDIQTTCNLRCQYRVEAKSKLVEIDTNAQ